MLTSETVKQWAKECGADLVGIGSMDRFEGAPLQSDPRQIFPEAKSIIGLGFRIHRGLLRGIEEGTYFAAYAGMGYANINDVYAPMVLREVGNLLEDNGYEAVLYQNTSVRLGTGVGQSVAPGKPKPDVFLHFRIAAVVCGMGEIGWSKVFLSPQFGPRQRLAFILTDAPLDPDPLFEGQICDRCMMCAQDCPANAISKSNSVKVNIAGKELEWGELDQAKCSAVYQAGSPEYSPFLNDKTAAAIRKVLGKDTEADQEQLTSYTGSIWGYLRDNLPYSHNAWESYHHPSAIGGARGCMRACMIHLEETGRISNTFHNPFRKRKPWRL